MPLKSSEINQLFLNQSVQHWNLLFLLLLPAAKHAFHRIVRPMNRLWEWILKIFLYSQKWNAQSSSRCTFCEWRRRWITFFETSYSERERFPGSISIQFLLSMGTILGEELAGSLLCGFAFAFDRHTNLSHSVVTHYSSSWSSGISVSLLFKSITKLIWSMRNSDPGVSIVSAQRLNSDLNSVLTVQATSCTFQHGVQFLCFSGSILQGCDVESSLGRVYSRQATVLNCVKSPVSFVMKWLSILHNTQKSCIHTKFTHFVLLW